MIKAMLRNFISISSGGHTYLMVLLMRERQMQFDMAQVRIIPYAPFCESGVDVSELASAMVYVGRWGIA